MSFFQDLRVALRSLARTKRLQLRLSHVGARHRANAPSFSLVRGVAASAALNSDEERLIYIKKAVLSAPGVPFSVRKFQDLRACVKTLSSFGSSPPCVAL